MVSGHYNPRVIDDAKLNAWINGDGIRQEVTRSYYDEFNTTFYTPPYAVNQDNHPDCYFLSPSSLVEGQKIYIGTGLVCDILKIFLVSRDRLNYRSEVKIFFLWLPVPKSACRLKTSSFHYFL
jgi:hypothetical protein